MDTILLNYDVSLDILVVTFIHELGHYLLHMNVEKPYSCDDLSFDGMSFFDYLEDEVEYFTYMVCRECGIDMRKGKADSVRLYILPSRRQVIQDAINTLVSEIDRELSVFLKPS